MRKRTRPHSGGNAHQRLVAARKDSRVLHVDRVAADKDECAASGSGLAPPAVRAEVPVSRPTRDVEHSAEDDDSSVEDLLGSPEADASEPKIAEEELESELASSESGDEEDGESEGDLMSDEHDSVADEVAGSLYGEDDEAASSGDVVLSEDDDEEVDEHQENLLSSVPMDDREALRDMIERAVEATRKNGNKKLLANLTRKEVLKQLSRALSRYYGYNAELTDYFLTFFGPEECLEFYEACDAPRPTTIRCNTLKSRRRDLAQTLIARGVNVDVLGDWSKHGLLVIDSTVPVGATPEYLAGHYMLQASSSLLPVIALQPKPDEQILDMAAAPGGKSSYIAQMMRNTGCVVANDANKTRCFALTANLHRLGVRNALVTNFDGRKLHEHFSARAFDRVLLDAPCSGSGVFSKDPAAKVKRTPEDFQRLQCLQKELLSQAIDLCKCSADAGSGGKGVGSGYIVYSTCSISVEENEGVIDYILKKKKVRLVDTGISFGMPGLSSYREKRFNDNMALTRRFYPHKNNMDGFFVAKLQKIGD